MLESPWISKDQLKALMEGKEEFERFSNAAMKERIRQADIKRIKNWTPVQKKEKQNGNVIK